MVTTTVSGIPAHKPAVVIPAGRRGTAGIAAMPASEVVAFLRHDAPHLPSVRMWRPSSSTVRQREARWEEKSVYLRVGILPWGVPPRDFMLVVSKQFGAISVICT